jgi:hypothetical protein
MVKANRRQLTVGVDLPQNGAGVDLFNPGLGFRSRTDKFDDCVQDGVLFGYTL